MPKKKILLVDDSKTVLMVEQMILSKAAYEIVTASDGQQAIEKTAAP
jgi:CheY-like chemotaxis protein